MTNKDKKRVFFRRRKNDVTHNYAFIDSQNLNLGVQRAGWKMDWKKFRQFLKNEHDVEKAYMFIGYMPENEDLYTQMSDAGYIVVLKPTLNMFTNPDEEKDEKMLTKGNVDAELVMYVMKELPHYKKAVIVSGDGDFYSLIEYLIDRKKLHLILTPNWKYSTLLKPFESHIVRLDQLGNKLAYRKYHSSGKGKQKVRPNKTKKQSS